MGVRGLHWFRLIHHGDNRTSGNVRLHLAGLMYLASLPIRDTASELQGHRGMGMNDGCPAHSDGNSAFAVAHREARPHIRILVRSPSFCPAGMSLTMSPSSLNYHGGRCPRPSQPSHLSVSVSVCLSVSLSSSSPPWNLYLRRSPTMGSDSPAYVRLSRGDVFLSANVLFQSVRNLCWILCIHVVS